MEANNSARIITLSADVVAAYVSFNTIEMTELPVLIKNVYEIINLAARGPTDQIHEKQAPAVPIHKSVTPDFIICLEDGRKYKSLKRHILNTYQMTPADYRAKWGLPKDYPMVAPRYSALRSTLAKELGLGFGDRAANTNTPATGRAKGEKKA